MDHLLIFLLSTIGHFFGDFVFQPEPVALKKAGLNKYMWAHVLIVSLTTVVPFLLIDFSTKVLLAFAIVLFSHLGVDNVKKVLTDAKGASESRFWRVLGLDQIIHVVFIYILLVYIFGG